MVSRSRQLNCRRAKMHAFVSVVLPTFNRADTLLRSARSVLDMSAELHVPEIAKHAKLIPEKDQADFAIRQHARQV
jgi:hypothetical protein